MLLSGARPRRNAVSPYLGVTIDQLIAKKYGQDTILSSIQLGVEDTGNFGNCNWGYSCAYTNSISWTSPTQPLPTEVNPRVAFERLFGDGASPEERLAGRKQNASILDSVTQEISFFKKDLGAGDRSRLDTYLENIREIERRIKIAMNKTVKEPSAEIPFGLPESKTRPLPLDVRPAGAGVRRRHHALRDVHAGPGSLGRELPGIRFQRRLARIVAPRRQAGERRQLRQDEPLSRAEPGVLRRQAERRSRMATARVLDHILIYKGSNMGNSHRHAHVKVPVILVGGLDGTFKGNRHIVFPDNTERTSNMLLSILHMYGIDRPSFGSSTGRRLRLEH